VQNEQYTGSASADPSALCNRFCGMLDMDNRTTMVATNLAQKMKSNGVLAGRSPLSSAAACIYMAGLLMGQPKSAKDIQHVVKVSDSTIRQAYKLLWNDKDKLIDDEILKRGADVSKLVRPS
jgi:transcription initiation factor TFIIB